MSDDGNYYNPFCTSDCGNSTLDARVIIVPNCRSYCGSNNFSQHQLLISAPLCTYYCGSYNEAPSFNSVYIPNCTSDCGVA